MPPEQSEMQSSAETNLALPPEALEAYDKARLFFTQFFDTAPQLRKQRKTREYHRLLEEVTVVRRFFPQLYEDVAQGRMSQLQKSRQRRQLPDTLKDE